MRSSEGLRCLVCSPRVPVAAMAAIGVAAAAEAEVAAVAAMEAAAMAEAMGVVPRGEVEPLEGVLVGVGLEDDAEKAVDWEVTMVEMRAVATVVAASGTEAVAREADLEMEETVVAGSVVDMVAVWVAGMAVEGSVADSEVGMGMVVRAEGTVVGLVEE